MLLKHGARLIGTDVDVRRLERFAHQFGHSRSQLSMEVARDAIIVAGIATRTLGVSESHSSRANSASIKAPERREMKGMDQSANCGESILLELFLPASSLSIPPLQTLCCKIVRNEDVGLNQCAECSFWHAGRN